MLAQIGSQLGIDHTLLYQFGLIVVFYALVAPLYLKPFQRLFEEREAKTAGAVKEAQELLQKADQKFAEYTERSRDVHARVRQALRKSEEDAKKEAAKILEEASRVARARVQDQQRDIDAQKGEVLKAITAESTALAREIVAKVLGKTA